MINNLATYGSGLPLLVVPVTVNKKESTQYLGGRYVDGDITVTLSYFAKTKAEIDALYAFWKNDCNSGSKLFILQMDIFGINSLNKYAVKWIGDFSQTREGGIVSKGNITLLVKYIVDANNSLIEIN